MIRRYQSMMTNWQIDDEKMAYLRTPRSGQTTTHPLGVLYRPSWTPIDWFVVWTRGECARNVPLHNSKLRGSFLENDERYLCVQGVDGYWIDTVVIEQPAEENEEQNENETAEQR